MENFSRLIETKYKALNSSEKTALGTFLVLLLSVVLFSMGIAIGECFYNLTH